MILGFHAKCLATAAMMLSASALHAQTATPPSGTAAAPQTLPDDIIVTAQKREQRLIDVPQSVSVVSAELLRSVHAERLEDYFTRIPSASFVEAQAGQGRLVLRGINTGGVGATVATYVDETPYGSATSLANGGVLAPDLDPSDVQRIEVLRGPQGTLYGANSLGGLVKYVTTLPDTTAVHATAEGNVEGVAHGSTGASSRASLNLPLADTIAVRASGFYRQDPGYIDDLRRGRDINDGRTYGGRVSVLAKPLDRLTIRVTGVLQNLHSNGTNEQEVDPVTLAPVFGRLIQNRIVAQPNDIRYRVYNGTVNYNFGAVSLVSATSWGNLDQLNVQDATGVYGDLLTGAFGIPLGSSLDQRLNQRRFTEEVRLASTRPMLGGLFEWTIGGFYTRERNVIDQRLNAVDAGTGRISPGLDGLALVNIASRYREIAGFANGTIHFTPRFDLTFGGRYSHNKQTATTVNGGPLQGDSTFDVQSSDNVFTYSVAPSFKPNTDTTIYARIARGYRPGGPNLVPAGVVDPALRQFGADTTTNYEVGIKSDLLDRKLSVELTGFYIDWKNIQLLTAVNGVGINTNGGSARSKGVEATVTLRPTPGLSLGANGAYVDASLTADAGLSGGLKGNRLPYVARFASTLSADYERPLNDRINGIGGISWRYTGPRQSGFDPVLGQNRLAGFSQVDAHLGATFDRYRVEVFARNLTDSRGIVNLGAAGSALNGAIAAAVVRPRSIGATFAIKY